MHTALSIEHDRVLALHAEHLIAYANSDRDFAKAFATTIREYEWTPGASSPYETTRHLTPSCRAAAQQNAQWLLSVLTHSSDYELTKGTLAAWANDADQPHAIVIGVVGMAIMGPTLGILEKKKKKKSKLQLVFSKHTYTTHSKGEIAKLATRLSHQQIATELRLAGGDMRALHPDTADWLQEEQLVEIFIAQTRQLTELSATAVSERLPHCLHATEQKEALVLSPCVEDSFLGEADLRKI